MKKLSRLLLILTAAILWASFVALSGLVVQNSLPYFSDLASDPFVIEKGAVGQTWWWQALLVTHVLAGLICLCSVMLQFFRGILRRFPWLHRCLGRIYSWSILILVVPTGMVLAFYAKGGFLGSLGFMLNGFLAFVFTWKGLTAIWRRDMGTHVRWMIRSFAMVAAALTFRLLHVILFHAGVGHDLNYILSLWSSTLGNLLVAEGVIFLAMTARSRSRKPSIHAISQSLS